MMNYQILIVGPSSSGLKGGQVTHMENIKELFSEKLSYYYSSSGKEGGENFIIKVLRLLSTWFLFPFNLYGIRLVHINSSFDNKALVRDLILFFWCSLFRKKMVIQYHGGDPNFLMLLKLRFFLYVYLKFVCNAKILVLTEQQERWFYEKSKIKSIRMQNYVQLPDISKHCNVDTNLKFIYIGRIIREKGVFNIVDSSSLLAEEYEFSVDIYGNGEDEKELIEYIKRKDLSRRVKFHGVVSGRDKESVLLDADCFLYPSYYPEGLPYSVLEAMSYGKSIISTDAGALKELLIDGYNCVKVEMKSIESLRKGMLVVLLDNELRRDIAMNARGLIESEMSLPRLKHTLIKVWNDKL